VKNWYAAIVVSKACVPFGKYRSHTTQYDPTYCAWLLGAHCHALHQARSFRRRQSIISSILFHGWTIIVVDVKLGVVQPHDNRFVSGKLDGVPHPRSGSPSASSDQLAKDLRRWRYIQSCSSLCRWEMFYGYLR
jgi:hypothetical protein